MFEFDELPVPFIMDVVILITISNKYLKAICIRTIFNKGFCYTVVVMNTLLLYFDTTSLDAQNLLSTYS